MRLATRHLMASVFLCAATSAAALATVIYVNVAATGSNTGTSWANAYTSLQSGLTTAVATDEIWVAAGTYKPIGTTDRTVSFPLKNGVGVYGGFNGTETQRSQRDPVAHVTILSGDIGTPGLSGDNSYHVVTADGTVTSSGVLDGFTVTAGQADGVNPNDRGAGMWDNGGAPMLARLIFSGNFASFEGGGLRITSGAPTILNSSFLSNFVGFGGAGAGIRAGGGSTVYAQNCVFRSNAISGASTGGGGIESAGGTTLINCVVAQNSPNGMQTVGDNNLIENCTFTSNAGYGAAFFVSNNNSITNSVFWGDSVSEIFNDGSSSISAEFSDIQGGGFVGAGNINADPLFLGAPADLRPGPGSPAVDSGKNLDVPGGVILDLAGLPRFFDDPDVIDTGSGIPPIVDMGAYERVPITVTAPSNLTVCSGDSAGFSVTATGQPTLTYQWRKGGVNLSNGGAISGATTDTLTINPAATGDSGNYDIVVTDGFGQSITSSAATLTVNTRPTAAASGGGTICSGDSVALLGSGGVSCSWLPVTGLSDASSCTPDANPSSTMIYALTVTAANGCTSTNSASVTVTVNQTPAMPVITAPISVPVGASGASASVVNHAGASWAWTLSGGGVITAGQGSRQIVFDAGPPGTTMLCTVIESAGGCFSPMAQTLIQVDFLDVPPSDIFHSFVVTLARNAVTSGCGGGNYCRNNSVTRAQMAVFLLKAEHGSTYVPPSCTGVFPDVACPGGFAVDWIEQLFAEGITGGCGGGNYCPANPVRRDQMAVFLLKAEHGSSYLPPACTGVFPDVPCPSTFAAWIEQLAAEQITGGCGGGNYCPLANNTRGQMAVFIVKTFSLQ